MSKALLSPVTPTDSLIVLLVSPVDRHGDAARLRQAGLRVVATSQVMETPAQMLRAAPTVIAIEQVPAFVHETTAFVGELAAAARRRRIALIVYGPGATDSNIAAIRSHGALWVEVAAIDRTPLIDAVTQAITRAESSASRGL